MTDNKQLTANEILQKYLKLLSEYEEYNVCDAMQEFATQQTKSLQEQIGELNKIISYAAEQKFKQEERYDKLKASADELYNQLEIMGSYLSKSNPTCIAMDNYKKLNNK